MATQPTGTLPPPVAARPRSGRIEGLDGVRAVAVLTVLGFHLWPALLPGGYLGVDVFFVVSGFLITTLLLREVGRNGRIDLKGFWLRRARRLLPALFLVVVTSTALALPAGGDLLVNIRRQTLGAVTFSNNWLEIAAGSDYFAHTAPVLFMNFWSLAVEEQFYLCWPLALTLLLAFVPGTRPRLRIVLAVAAASALLMAVLFSAGAGTTRVYYGTDTHLFGLMVGAALAFGWASPARPLERPRWVAVRIPAAVACAGVLLLLMGTMSQRSPFTFRGGILLASVLTAVVLAGLLDTDSALRRTLQARPLTWVGERSYGIYLWHWPLLLIAGAALPPGTAPIWLTRCLVLGVTLLIAAASFRWLETPVRRLGFVRAGRVFTVWVGQPWRQARAPRLTAGLLVALLLLSVVAVVTAPGKSEVQRQIEAGEAIVDSSAGPAGPAQLPPAPGPAPPAAARPRFLMPAGPEITAFGDSLVVTSAGGLTARFPGIMLDAKSNRQWPAARPAVEARLAEGSVRRAVVLDFGTNAGVHDPQLVHDVINLLGPDRMIVLVNLYGSWEESNPALAAIAAAHPNVELADWYGTISAHPDLLQADGVHPGIKGAQLYADVIAEAFTRLSAR